MRKSHHPQGRRERGQARDGETRWKEAVESTAAQVWDLKRGGLTIQRQPCRVRSQLLLRAIPCLLGEGQQAFPRGCFLTWWMGGAWEGTPE